MQGLSEDVGSSIRDPSNWRPTKPTMQHEGEDCSVWTPLPKTVLETIMPQGIWPLRGVLGRNCRGEVLADGTSKLLLVIVCAGSLKTLY